MLWETHWRCSAEVTETKSVQIPCKDLKSTIVTVSGIRVNRGCCPGCPAQGGPIQSASIQAGEYSMKSPLYRPLLQGFSPPVLSLTVQSPSLLTLQGPDLPPSVQTPTHCIEPHYTPPPLSLFLSPPPCMVRSFLFHDALGQPYPVIPLLDRPDCKGPRQNRRNCTWPPTSEHQRLHSPFDRIDLTVQGPQLRQHY